MKGGRRMRIKIRNKSIINPVTSFIIVEGELRAGRMQRAGLH